MSSRKIKVLRARIRLALRAEIHALWRRSPIAKDTVFYESFSGNGMLGNPEAIFRGLLAAEDMAHLSHVWALKDLRAYGSTIREFADNPRIRFVRSGSPAYFRALATSEYLVNNATFPTDFGKRVGQTYLNTWHGTPLKRMGYDIPNGAIEAANTMRNLVSADYLLSASPYMTSQMYRQAYKLEGFFRGTIIEEGYPRIDRQEASAEEKQAVRDRLEESGIPLGDREIILYAPTWKGTTFRKPVDDVTEMVERAEQLQASLDDTRYIVLLKIHQAAHTAAQGRSELNQILVPNEIPTNLILSVSSTLITDYSSIYFDFLTTGRPILFYSPDLAEYDETRGYYLAPDEWPGPVCRTMAELVATLSHYLGGGAARPDVSTRYEDAVRRFCPYEDGHATDRIIDIVFRGATHGYRTLREDAGNRESILLYLGGMARNGITTSALNLLNTIDHTRFDVSVTFAQGNYWSVPATQKEINPHVRQFPRIGGMNGSKLAQLRRHLEFRIGQMGLRDADPQRTRLWDDEWVRCFGDSTFDYVVDFSGYGPFWSVLLLHSPPAIRSIWLHNDLAQDAHRTINGRKPMLRGLSTVFRVYRRFDRLVSVSPSLARINRESLARYADPDRFGWARNTIDAKSIIASSHSGLRQPTRDNATNTTVAWIDALSADDGVTTFVNVGRLSPEKNQARLIRAFAAVHSEYPKTRLVIVGSGPLRASLERQVAEAGLAADVFFTGHQPRPSAIMRASDCFVLSSDYEGQPMVILESLVLGLPVVSVAFGSRRHDGSEFGEYVVEQSDQGLAEGMIAFLQGKVPTVAFDAEQYNRDAINEFYRAIGASESCFADHSVNYSVDAVA